MPNQPTTSIENNFTGGLKTEFTGLNFPENACTDVDNCVFSLIGDVLRREGIDYEEGYQYTGIQRANYAVNSYKWNNVGGDGQTQVVVVQVGVTLYFYQSSNATVSNPLSTTRLTSTIDISDFLVVGSSGDPAPIECQFSDGNGYLFVFHPFLEPFFCTYSGGVITAAEINIQVRDFNGIPEPGIPINNRPASLTNEHTYNLYNQGWNQGAAWQAVDNLGTWSVAIGSHGFTVASGISGITNGERVQIYATSEPSVNFVLVATGSVTGYSSTTLTIDVDSAGGGPGTFLSYTIIPVNAGLINTWLSAVGNYPSNADVWWQFKDDTNVFNPGTTVGNVTLNSGPAPKGYFILSAFLQDRSSIASIPDLAGVETTIRPKTGAWFSGRVWYAGADVANPPTGDQPYYTWTENIYFSQVAVDSSQFGMCYQNNDPTSEDLFDLLPTDGGVITIQGSGAVYKLFPIQNGLLVFAANGIWFITGSEGLGFAANDYTITKISSVQSISGTSFINVLGWPVFWNEEGIYLVNTGKENIPYGHGGLVVENICLGTILSYYNGIPLQSKKFARGDYNPITFVISWLYRSDNESSVTDRYQYDSQLNLNTANRAFYPYSISQATPNVHDIKYVAGPGGSTSPDPVFKYLTSALTTRGGVFGYYFTFSEERDDTNWVDFYSFDNVGVNYVSNFITGYKLHGQAQRRWQPGYVYMFSRNDVSTSYKIQGIWDFATSGNSGKYSTVQIINNDLTNFGMVYRRHRIRGQGLALQLQVISVDGQPFNIMGWTIWENQNMSV